ncbi:MAG: sulfite exporter TauE/SafE family protein [Candidatus Poseidoniaceae archaeon]|nr:sulfite exporter TauE/SafE family protein [Candidatus Poseidoniaceae archaeon]
MEQGFALIAVCIGLFLISTLYSSVGHGGASGYLALLSLTAFGQMDSAWLKQHAWVLNLAVAGLAFVHYSKNGHHVLSKSIPFLLASVPFAFIGGYLEVDGAIYDTLLSLTLIYAALRLYSGQHHTVEATFEPVRLQAYSFGAGIGFFSGIIGVGGGIFLSPILLLKKWATPKTAAATAALFIWVNSAAGLLGATASGQLNLEINILFPFLIAVGIGGFIGSRYGSRYADQKTVQNILIVVLLLASIKRIIDILFLF